MKLKFLVISLFISFSFLGHSQEKISVSNISIDQKIDISKYIGKRFKLSASIRMEKNNGNGSTSLWTYIITNDKNNNVFNDDIGSVPVSENWQTYTIEGVIKNENSQNLLFGVLCYNNGDFFFDDFKLEIENTKDSWISLDIKNPGFEEVPEITNEIWGNKLVNTTREYTASRTTSNVHSGSYALHVEGKGVYGQNDHLGGFVDVNGVSIYHEIYGEGEPLLLLHGAGQSISGFGNQIDHFAKEYKVIAVDSRGRGRSTDNDQELTYMNQAEDIRLFMEHLLRVHLIP